MSLASIIELTRALFIPVNGEQNMHFRSYTSRLDNNTLSAMTSVTQGGLDTSRQAMSRVAPMVLSPSSNSQGVVNISEGWGGRRYSVILEFSVRTPFATSKEIIIGYTDYLDVSLQGTISPYTTIHPNSHTVTSVTENIGYNGTTMAYTCTQANQILTPVSYTTHDNQQVIASSPIRPVDNLHAMQLRSYNLAGDTLDTRSSLNNSYLNSRQDNTVTSRYLSRICEAYKKSRFTNTELGEQQVCSGAINTPEMSEDLPFTNVIFNQLKEQTQFSTQRAITYAELASVWPNLENVKVVMPASNGQESNAMYSNHWGGNTLETQVAFIVARVLPSLLAPNLIAGYAFSMHNYPDPNNFMPGDTSINYTTLSVNWMLDLGNGPIRLQQIEAVMKTDIHNQILALGVGNYMLQVRSNMYGSVHLEISLDGQPAVDYSAPMYCDSLFTPIIASSNMASDAMVSDMDTLLGTLFGDTNV